MLPLKKILKSKFIIDFLSMLTSNVSMLFIGLLVSIIYNRNLGPEGIGLYAILTNFSLLFVSLAELGIRQSTIYYSGKGMYKLNDIFAANTGIWLFSSIIGIIIFYSIFYVNKVVVPTGMLILSSLIIPVTIANSFISGVMLGADKIQKTAVYKVVNGIIKLSLAAILVWALKLYVAGALITFMIPTVIIVILKYNFLKKSEQIKLRLMFNFEIIKKLIGHGILYGIALFLMTNQKKIPILLMAGRISEHDIGIYGAGFTFTKLFYQVYNALAPVVFVKSSRANNPMENSLKVQKLMRVIFVLYVILSVIFFFALKFLIPLMYGEEFVESITITRILVFGIIFYVIFLILNMDLAGRGKPWISIISLIPVTLINFFSNYYFIGIYGNIGAAFSTAASTAIGVIIFLFFYSKEVGISIMQILKPQKTDWDFLIKIISKVKKRYNK